MIFNKAEKKYLSALKDIFDSPAGHYVLAVLKEKEMDHTALVPNDPMSTGYCLGRKELVQEFINCLKEDSALDEVKIETES
jgi:hypothetical protein